MSKIFVLFSVAALTVPSALMLSTVANAQQAQAAPTMISASVAQGMSRERLGRIADVMKQE
jgi:hypothetical protein